MSSVLSSPKGIAKLVVIAPNGDIQIARSPAWSLSFGMMRFHSHPVDVAVVALKNNELTTMILCV